MAENSKSFPLSRRAGLFAPLALFVWNAFLVHELFALHYGRFMHSIEGAYVGLARWIAAHPFDWQWFPLWYGGIPFQNAYPPLLHFFSAALSGAGLTPAHAYHAASALMYCLGPVTLYWLARRFGAGRGAAFAAGLVYSLLSPSALLIPAVARDLGTAWGARRLDALMRFGEGPHVAAMAWIPVALIALDRALERPRPLRVLAAMAALGAVVLTNWLGAFALTLGTGCYLLATWEAGGLRRFVRAAAIGAAAYALCSPWIPHSTIRAVRYNSQHVVGSYPLGWAQGAAGAAFLLLVLALWRLMAKRGVRSGVQFAALWSLALGAIVLCRLWFGFYIVPQPDRYHLEMEMALALLACFALQGPSRRAWRAVVSRTGKPRLAATAVCLLAASAAFIQTAHYRRDARRLIQPIDIRGTVEYQAARWFDENLPGSRVFVTGSTRFWFNAFAGNPQFGGGFDQGIVNRRIPHVSYGITHAEADPERVRTWLQIFGIDAIFVAGPNTRDAYHDYRDPGKFEGRFELLWRDGDDRIYAAGRRAPGLVHVIPAGAVVTDAPGHPYLDVEPFAPLEAALEDPAAPSVETEWRSPHELLVEAGVPAGHVLYFQQTCHPGWHAERAGEPRPIACDAAGQMVIDPGCDGPCTVRLYYDGGLEMQLCRTASAGVLLGLGVWALVRRRSL